MTNAEIKALKPGDRVRVHGIAYLRMGTGNCSLNLEGTIVTVLKRGRLANTEHCWAQVELDQSVNGRNSFMLESDEYIRALGRDVNENGQRLLGAELLAPTPWPSTWAGMGMYGSGGTKKP